MSKAYMLVICLLAASFTGCLADDDIEEQKISPVGTDDGGEDYDELVSEIQNLTEEIERLREDIQSLEVYQYNPPEDSTLHFRQFSEGNYITMWTAVKSGNNVTIFYEGQPDGDVAPVKGENQNYDRYDYNWTGCEEDDDADNNGTGTNGTDSDDCDQDGIENEEDNCPLDANNNQADSDEDGLGDVCDNYTDTVFSNSPCTAVYQSLTFYDAQMNEIRSGYGTHIADSFERDCVPKSHFNNNDGDFGQFYSSLHFELKDEPVRLYLFGQTLTF
jgi:hypothetical protein